MSTTFQQLALAQQQQQQQPSPAMHTLPRPSSTSAPAQSSSLNSSSSAGPGAPYSASPTPSYSLPSTGGTGGANIMPTSTAPCPPAALNSKFLPYAIPVGGGGCPHPAAVPINGSSHGNSYLQPSFYPAMPAPSSAPRSTSTSNGSLGGGQHPTPRLWQQQPQQHLPQQQAPPSSYSVATPPVAAAQPWGCAVCTYVHEGVEAEFLSCALCGTPKCE
jgi:hypothetical protein